MAATAVEEFWQKDIVNEEANTDASTRIQHFTKDVTENELPSVTPTHMHAYYRLGTTAGLVSLIREGSLAKSSFYEALFDTPDLALLNKNWWLRSRLDEENNETWSLKMIENSTADGIEYRELKDKSEILEALRKEGFQAEADSKIEEDSPMRLCPEMISMFQTWRFKLVAKTPRNGNDLSAHWHLDYAIVGDGQVYGCLTFSRGAHHRSNITLEKGRSKIIVALALDRDSKIGGNKTIVEKCNLLGAEEANALCFSEDIEFFDHLISK